MLFSHSPSCTLTSDEAHRLSALRQYNILGTAKDSQFDDITQIASCLTGCPIALITFIDETRTWIKSSQGMDLSEVPRESSLCAMTIGGKELFEIPDTLQDPRTFEHAMVLQAPFIRYYAGVPLTTSEGFNIGTLCVLDYIPRQLETSQVTALYGLARRILDQLETKRSYAQLSRILDGGQDGFWEWDMVSGYIQTSDSFAHMLGYLPEEIPASLAGWDKLIHPVDKQKVESLFFEALEEGQDHHTFEYRFRAKDGSWRWVLDRGKVIQRDKEGKPLLASGTYTDVDSRVRTEMALFKSRKELAKSLDVISRNHNLLNGLRDIQDVFIASPDNREAFDQLLKLLLDFTGSEYGFIGEVLHSDKGLPYLKTHAQTNISWDEETRKFYEENAPGGLEFTNLKTLFGAVMTSGDVVISNSPGTDPRRGGLPPGHPPLDRFLGIPIKVGGQFVGMVGLANRSGGYDRSVVNEVKPILATYGNLISARRERIKRELAEKRAQQASTNARRAAEKANRAKDAFLATMSHEIRTPMNGVVGMADLLSNDPAFPECYTDHIKVIRDSSLSLLRIIDDVLDFSKIESGHLSLDIIPCSVSDIVVAVCSNFSAMVKEKRLILNSRVDAAVPDLVSLDPTRVRQVLMNLVGNAVKFSSNRPGITAEVAVDVSICDSAGQKPVLTFCVVDNGIGMSPHTIENLSKPFSQADNSITRRFGGTGLGLSITRSLLQLMGGQLSFESALDKGSRFTACIPIKEDTNDDGLEDIDLYGVNCLFIAKGDEKYPELVSQLKSAGINVVVAPDLAAVQQQVETGSDWVILRFVDETKPDVKHLLDDFAGLTNLRQVVIAEGRRHEPRIVGDDIVILDAESLSRGVLLRSIAIAVNRSSPQVHWGNSYTAINSSVLPLAASGDAASILIAEDDAVNRQVITRQLELLGFTAEIAVNGEEALAKWRTGNFELLLADLHMPIMDGYSLAKAIRREEPSGQHLPILAFTANALKGEMKKALRVGMDGYLTKPIQIAQLRAALLEWLPSCRDHSS